MKPRRGTKKNPFMEGEEVLVRSTRLILAKGKVCQRSGMHRSDFGGKSLIMYLVDVNGSRQWYSCHGLEAIES